MQKNKTKQRSTIPVTCDLSAQNLQLNSSKSNAHSIPNPKAQTKPTTEASHPSIHPSLSSSFHLRSHFPQTQMPLLFLLLLLLSPPCSGFPATLPLERGFPFPTAADLDAVSLRDAARHARILGDATRGAADFPVFGTSNPYTVGLYFSRVKLGNPAKEFYVQIDTGSDVLWVTCVSCSGCPISSSLNIPMEFFDPRSSSSALLLSCSDERCSYGIQTSSCISSLENSPCGYSFKYGDGSGTSGYFVSDTMYFDTVVGSGVTINSSAKVIFGCSNSQSGDLSRSDHAVDGIFGFGQHALSIISQLSSSGVAPGVFSHCLRGSDNGGGVLVLGEIVEPGIVYTPLVQNQPHYNLNLQSIAVNGQILPIDSSVFATSTSRGTIIDSGTTLAYLAEEIYDLFLKAIVASISQPVKVSASNGYPCFAISSRAEEVFPPVTLKFEGGASLMLMPRDYLIRQGSINNAEVWCLGWRKNEGQGTTILGDIVLKDKIFVYDLVRQRIGWVNYDCSLPVNVSASPSVRSDFFNTGQYRLSSSCRHLYYNLILFGTIVFIVHTILKL